MSMTITDVITEYGAYYIDGGQGVQDILKNYYQPSVTHSYFNPVPTKDTLVRRAKFLKSSVLQAYQKAFTPKGGAAFTPSEIALAWMKVDESETFEELHQSWLGFLVGLDTADKKSWPFVRWYMNHVLSQANQDYELNEIWKGVTGVVTPGTATANGASMNGLAKQIADGIVASEITPITSNPTWSTDPVDFVDEIEAWVKEVEGISNEHRILVEGEIDYLFMSIQLRNRYATGLRLKYNMQYDQTGISLTGVKMELPLVDSNIRIVGLPSMTGSNRIFMTPKENRAAFDRIPQGRLPLQLETETRNVKIFGDIHKGIGFWYKPFVFTNQLV